MLVNQSFHCLGVIMHSRKEGSRTGILSDCRTSLEKETSSRALVAPTVTAILRSVLCLQSLFT